MIRYPPSNVNPMISPATFDPLGMPRPISMVHILIMVYDSPLGAECELGGWWRVVFY